MDMKVYIKKATEVGVEVEDGIQFSGCQCPTEVLTGASPKTKAALDEIVAKSGFKSVGSILCPYPGEGSGYVYFNGLAESHIVVATWPEEFGVRNFPSACNLNQNNRGKAELLIQGLRRFFRPTVETVPEMDLLTGRRFWTW
ncbi:MAG: hypothetical protein AAB355_00795 [Patescibacteria group bacterium]